MWTPHDLLRDFGNIFSSIFPPKNSEFSILKKLHMYWYAMQLHNVASTRKKHKITKFSKNFCWSRHLGQLIKVKKQLKYEPRCEKTGFLHMRKQRRRSASRYREIDQRLCFHYTDSTIPLLSKSEISSF